MKAIYLRIPKCGSTSVARFCDANKIPWFGGKHMGFWSTPKDNGTPKNRYEQLYKCVSAHLGEDLYKESYVFSAVRNPYARAVSLFNLSQKEACPGVKSFKDLCYIIKNDNFPTLVWRWHCTTITEHIVDQNELKVDGVIRLDKGAENIQKEFNIVCDKTGVRRQKLPHKNKSSYHKHYTEYYDNETRQIVEEKYGKDIEYFDYKFGE